MQIITNNELKEVKKSLSFYDFKNHDSLNGQIIVKFKEGIDITRFDDIRFGGRVEDFEQQASALKKIMLDTIDYFTAKSILVVKYQPKWIANSQKSKELSNWFYQNSLRANFSGALIVKEKWIIEEFFMANLKNNSFVHFVIPDLKIIITPTDHLDIFIVSSEIEETLQVIDKICVNVDKDRIKVFHRK